MIVMLTDILTTIVLAGFLLPSRAKIVVALVFPDGFPDPGEHFPDVCVNPRVVEPSAPVTPGHDSYLGGSHVPAIINIPPQWTTRVSLTGVNPAQEPVL